MRLNKVYWLKQADRKFRIVLRARRTSAGKDIIAININNSSCWVYADQARKLGLLKAISKKRLYSKFITTAEYHLLGGAAHKLQLLQKQLAV